MYSGRRSGIRGKPIPINVCMSFPIQRLTENYKEAEREFTQPEALPSQRPRSLTLGSTSQLHATDQITHDQNQSILFALPPELRQIVWYFLLCGNVIHIVNVRKRLINIVCPCDDSFAIDDDLNHFCWSTDSCIFHRNHVIGREIHSPNPDVVEESLNVDRTLLVCRRMYVYNFCISLPHLISPRYSEVIDLVYSSNIFHVRHVDTMIDLGRTLLPQRLQTLRHLRLSWPFHFEFGFDADHPLENAPPYSRKHWAAAWSVINDMTALESLQVDLVVGYGDFRCTPTVVEWVFTPMCAVQHVEYFTVRMMVWSEEFEDVLQASCLRDKPFELHDSEYTFPDLREFIVNPTHK